MTNSETAMIEYFSKKSREEIFKELLEIKADLNCLDIDISLTEKQRMLYFDIKSRVKNLLENK